MSHFIWAKRNSWFFSSLNLFLSGFPHSVPPLCCSRQKEVILFSLFPEPVHHQIEFIHLALSSWQPLWCKPPSLSSFSSTLVYSALFHREAGTVFQKDTSDRAILQQSSTALGTKSSLSVASKGWHTPAPPASLPSISCYSLLGLFCTKVTSLLSAPWPHQTSSLLGDAPTLVLCMVIPQLLTQTLPV